MNKDRLYLTHIQECGDRIQEYITEGEKVFFVDRKTQDAVLRNLQTLSESVQRLSDDLKGTRPGIDWRNIAAFRNVVVHNYLGIDLQQIWNIIQNDLPELLAAIQGMLAEIEQKS